ncbi:unnamed protein product [Cyberlindnera jadinii]|uniref:Myb-like domain-containing protein n=1 Tax=Cyberlindnera jadinii (strain ATCC 18201 / CBS 1600 / BCRC 20928 / JCM 3617 / NBRC 0987 / NRRL Y-1542) TaxID=983966 RepID=A0A0H5C7G4_CYBJN|nr:unnamed protein product [Cyberlindnera jadinii]
MSQQHDERYQRHISPYSHPSPLPQLPQQNIYQYQYRPELVYRIAAPRQRFHHIEKPRQNNAWSYEDDSLLRYLKEKRNLGWREISLHFKNRTANGCQFRWRRLSALEKEKKQRLQDSKKTNDTDATSSTTQAVVNNSPPNSTKSVSSPSSPRHSLRNLLN